MMETSSECTFFDAERMKTHLYESYKLMEGPAAVDSHPRYYENRCPMWVCCHVHCCFAPCLPSPRFMKDNRRVCDGSWPAVMYNETTAAGNAAGEATPRTTIC